MFCGAGRLLRRLGAADGEQDVRLRRPPAIADAEVERGRALAVEVVQHRLIGVREDAERRHVVSEGHELPLVRLEEANGHAGVILHHDVAVVDDVAADGREVVGVQQVGRALDEAVGQAEGIAELEEAAGLHAVVGEIGREIVERLRLAVGSGREGDLRAARRILRQRRIVGGLHVAVGVERHEAHVADRLAGALEEHVEDRQRAAEPAAGELAAHLLGDEEAVVQHGVERVLDASYAALHLSPRHAGEVGDLADRLECGHDVGVGARIEGVGVEEVRPAEEVEHGRLARRQVLRRPRLDLRELTLVERGPGGVEALGVLLPASVLGVGGERGVRRRRHAGEDLRRIVRGCDGCSGLGRCRLREDEQQAQRKRNRLYRSGAIHRSNSPFWRGKAPGSARLHK